MLKNDKNQKHETVSRFAFAIAAQSAGAHIFSNFLHISVACDQFSTL
jgi:hypothetical protein